MALGNDRVRGSESGKYQINQEGRRSHRRAEQQRAQGTQAVGLWLLLTLLLFACDSGVESTRPEIGDGPSFYATSLACDPDVDPNCNDRPLTADEGFRVLSAIQNESCGWMQGLLESYFYSGKIRAFDVKARYNADWHWGEKIHVYAGHIAGATDRSLGYTLRHEGGHHACWCANQSIADSYANNYNPRSSTSECGAGNPV